MERIGYSGKDRVPAGITLFTLNLAGTCTSLIGRYSPATTSDLSDLSNLRHPTSDLSGLSHDSYQDAAERGRLGASTFRNLNYGAAASSALISGSTL